MALKSGQSETEPKVDGKVIMPGVYLKHTAIVNAVDYRLAELRWERKPDLIGVVLYMETGFDWQKDLIVTGFPRRDKDKNIIGFGNAFRVDKLLSGVGGFQGVSVNDEGQLNPLAVKALNGKEIYWIDFVTKMGKNGHPMYNAFSGFASNQEGPDAIVAEFKQAVANLDGSVKNYNPSILGTQADASTYLPPTSMAVVDPSFDGLEPAAVDVSDL
jgi:hypothetical protein